MVTRGSFTVTPARSAQDLAEVAVLFRSYAASLEVDLAYQGFEAELSGLPGKYAPPAGEILLARAAEGHPIGCVALRAMDPAGCCEMKRLYVAPEGRGLGLGEALVRALVGSASRAGYREMRLDTLPTMGTAMSLYAKLGFRDIPPYYDTPVAGTRFLALALQPSV